MTDPSAIAPIADFAHAPGPAATHRENPFEIFHRLHHLLRGRYLYAISLSALGAIAGALGGYKSTVPKYQSVGMIRIQSPPVKVYDIPEKREGISNRDVSSVAQLLKEPEVIRFAMSTDEWKATGRGTDPEAEYRFREALKVETTWDAPEWIYVKFLDPVPSVAKTAVEQIIDAFQAKHGTTGGFVTAPLIKELELSVTTLDTELAQLRARAQSIGEGMDVELLYRDSMEQVKTLQTITAQLDQQIKQAKAAPPPAPDTAPPGDADPVATAHEIAREDDQIRGMLSELSMLEARLQQLRARGLTERHRSVIDAQSAVTGQRNQISDAVHAWLDQHGGQLGSTSVGPSIPRLTPEQLRTAEASLATYQEMLDHAKAQAAVRRVQCDDAAEVASRVKKKEADKADIERRLTQIKTESPTNQSETRVIPISKGELPYKPYTDNRLKFAAIGMVLGGGIPLGLFLLWGLFDRRYRFSDEASSGRAHPTLLGILPYLPENIADPEQAAVAAHCVHQIRTLLQISGAHRGAGRGQVFAITSPTSGDGKTSLTLSLALSFASSGANTCVIDFDMVGGGLTSAMNAKTDLGLMDAIDNAELNGHIKPTGFKRLSIIPAGVNDAPEVSRLSPENVNRILAQARDQFDVVIVDTGPILGSLEASLVSAAADGVILALGRGQARPLADRAVDFLHSVGATLLGVVFNRAQPSDFRRAVSSASVRSVPSQGAAASGPMRALPALGPMARTVASHIRPADTDAR